MKVIGCHVTARQKGACAPRETGYVPRLIHRSFRMVPLIG